MTPLSTEISELRPLSTNVAAGTGYQIAASMNADCEDVVLTNVTGGNAA